MTARAGTNQSTRVHRPGRIIERPRLIKLLDEADAPVILIVAPAGYGKTTLARQWARTLTGVVWVSCTPSHRDVVTFSEDVAAGIDALGGNAGRFIGEYLLARSDPQRAAREIGLMLARKLNEAAVHWLVVDDYQELAESQEAEDLVSSLREHLTSRLMFLSRTRPDWVTERTLIYNTATEIGSAELALTGDEVQRILGSRPELEPLVRQSRGWPAVIALAAGLRGATVEPAESRLHRYVAEELFASAVPKLQEELIELALLPDVSELTTTSRFGEDGNRVVDDAIDLGFISLQPSPSLHPLLREFLLAKLAESGDLERVRRAVQAALDSEAWNLALDLVLRFKLADLIDPVLQRAFRPLVRGGRLETLRSFAARTKSPHEFPSAAVDVVDAELASRKGSFALAASIADRAHDRLPSGHGLRCSASLVAGRAYFLIGAFANSVRAYRAAADEATDDRDRVESAFGLAGTQMLGEVGDPTAAIKELAALRYLHPTYLVRYATVDLNVQRFSGFSDEGSVAEALEVLDQSPDPHARTAFTYTFAHVLTVRGEYRRAAKLVELLERDTEDFDLDFVRPFVEWMHASVSLGQRLFGETDRRLRRLEDEAEEKRLANHSFNARMLRARLMLQTSEAATAVELLQTPIDVDVMPSWQAEHLATEALGFACQRLTGEAKERADRADGLTRLVEVHSLAQAARAVAAANDGADGDAIHSLFVDAERRCVWDPAICALRSSSALREAVARDRTLRPFVSQLVQRSEDNALARQLGLPTRSHHSPSALLSPRELEVLGLMARGMRNKEIAAALFVAESTIKVHVHHIFEKLGVRSRSAAVARYERTRDR